MVVSKGMRRLLLTVAVAVPAWGLASVGYFRTSPLLGVEIGYNDAPVFYAAYYLAWSALVFLGLRYLAVFRESIAASSENVGLAGAFAVLLAGYVLFVVPRLPPVEWPFDRTPVEFFWAEPWYFLPKSAEILFQQVLIAALALALDGLRLGLVRTSLVLAALFGGFHLTLALSYPNPLYVIRYSVAAAIFGAIAPVLILRVRHGLIYSYAIHWGYYAVDIAVIHMVFARD